MLAYVCRMSRCRGITLQGLPCKRTVHSASGYCFDHEDQAGGDEPAGFFYYHEPQRPQVCKVLARLHADIILMLAAIA